MCEQLNIQQCRILPPSATRPALCAVAPPSGAAPFRKKKRKRKSRLAPSQRKQRRLKGLSYQAYLRTLDWQTLRKRPLKRARGMCEVCHRNPATQIHHIKYPPWGRWWEDKAKNLQALCGTCHKNTHSDPETPW